MDALIQHMEGAAPSMGSSGAGYAYNRADQQKERLQEFTEELTTSRLLQLSQVATLDEWRTLFARMDLMHSMKLLANLTGEQRLALQDRFDVSVWWLLPMPREGVAALYERDKIQ